MNISGEQFILGRIGLGDHETALLGLDDQPVAGEHQRALAEPALLDDRERVGDAEHQRQLGTDHGGVDRGRF